jgi:putative transposase
MTAGSCRVAIRHSRPPQCGHARTAAKRFKKVENATAVISKTLLVAGQSFRRLDAPELLPEVAEGVAYVNGERAKQGNEKAAA